MDSNQMAQALGGAFQRPAPQGRPGIIGKARDVISEIGYGMMGMTPERMARQQVLDEQRKSAMVQDAYQVNELLRQGRIDDAMTLVNQRVQLINQLGGDPSDTLEIYDMLRSGNARGAMDTLTGFLSMPEVSAYLPKAPEPIKLGANERLVNPVTREEIIGVAEGAGGGASMGLSPVWLQDAQGNYIPAQMSSAGGIVPTTLPEGMQAVPGAGQLSFDPNAIATRGAAQTGVDVARVQALTPVEAEQARAVTAAQQQAQIAAIGPRSEAEMAANLAASRGRRGAAVETRKDQFDLLDDLISVAKDNSSAWTTGLLGGALSLVPGTDAFDLARTLDTLQATAGFETLQNMRENSPTGGALGNVTERELALLQSTWSSVSQAQSKNQFEANLERFRNQIQRSWDRVNRAYERDYGVPYFSDESSGSQNAVPAQYRDVITPDIWQAMTPEERAAFTGGR